MPLDRSRSRRRAAAGYALLEALIAVIVTSVGFIGAARLQTLGTSFNASAGMRQRAVLLVSQMTDRMRANHAGMLLGAYNLPAANDASCLTGTGCTPQTLAVADMTQWLDDVQGKGLSGVQGGLPNGQGVVCLDSTPDDGTPSAPACDNSGVVYAVKVWWTDKLGTSRFVTSARPAS